MKESILKNGWIFTDIDGIREDDGMATYYLWDYDKLPPIEIELDDEFNWLKPYPEYFAEDSEDDLEYNFKEQLGNLEAEAKSLGLSIPKSFITFMSQSDLLRRIRSNTDCFFELGDYIQEIPGSNGLYFLHFLSDSQYCSLWYLCLDKQGNCSVVTSGNIYGHKDYEEEEDDEFEKEETEMGYTCAPSFNDFVFRFWIENEICCKQYEGLELTEMENRYTQYYLDGF